MEWQPVNGWKHYEVSSDGEVRHVNGRPVGQWLNDQGYQLVRLSRPRRMLRVHRLVAEAFVPNPSRATTVNHLNNNRSDNRSTNLAWCSQAENLAHAAAQGRMCRGYWVGKRSPAAILTNDSVREIRRAYAAGEGSLAALARRFGLSKRAVGRCVSRETYADVL
jgi:hypothetical protein